MGSLRQGGVEGGVLPPFTLDQYRPADKLRGKVALITGAANGIGAAAAVLFAREGARLSLTFLQENQKDADVLRQRIQRDCPNADVLLIPADLRTSQACNQVVERTVQKFGTIDILINAAGQQAEHERFEEIKQEEIENVFQTNVFSVFYMCRAVVPQMRNGGSIINTTSFVAFQGHGSLVDFSTAKGAVLALTRSLATQLAPRGIRVNSVAPGPILTPPIEGMLQNMKLGGRENFGKDTALGRPGIPDEVAPMYVFLASLGSSYVTGQTLHCNGGIILNA